MRFQSLVHLAEVAKALAPSQRLIVMGSSSLLASFPRLGDPSGPLEASYDADFLIESGDEQLAAAIEKSVGKGSVFAVREGYYADTLRPVVAETFPRGWEERLVPLPGCAAAYCLDPHDLAAVKMQAGRPKDLLLCATLLASGRLDANLIEERLRETRMTERMMILSERRFNETRAMAERLQEPPA